MGKEARRNRQAFLQDNPACIFCGGTIPATTKEHCPPKSLFQKKQWPEGFEFPACGPCNNGTSDDDLLIAFVGRIDPIANRGDLDGHSNGLMRSVHRQHPGLLREMFGASAIEARRRARSLGIRPDPGMTYQQSGIAHVPDRIDEAVKTLARKLSKAVYYKETGKVFPANGELRFYWFTNEIVFRGGVHPVLSKVAPMLDVEPPRIARAGQSLAGQFDYRYAMSQERDLSILQALFGRSFGFITIASTVNGVLARISANATAVTGVEQDILLTI